MTSYNSQSHEVPMNLYQRGIIDSCFEESQYDEGIALISQLKSPQVRPAASHLRELLYIALYPPEKKQAAIDTSFSPSKIGKQQKFLAFTSTTAASACSLLVYFAITNHPDGVAQALPCYDRSNIDNKGDNFDSLIAKESHCISTAKNCWTILERGFIRRTMAASSPSKKGPRRTNIYMDDDDDLEDTSGVVAEHAWPVLDFLLLLFEHDERRLEAAETLRYSSLLLNQIPAPRGGNGARWEADAPLSIVLHALTQDGNEQRQMMGARLMHLLVNLCSTNLFDFTMFLNSVFNRVYMSAPREFLTLLASLPPTIPVLKFRTAFLHKFLSSSAKSSVEHSPSRPKPYARARPIRRARGEPKHEEPTKTQPTSILSQITLSPYTEIRRSMEELQPSNEKVSYSWIRFQLLLSFALYQMQLPIEARDQEWQSLLRSGQFSQQLEKLIPQSEDPETAGYRDILEGAMLPALNP